MRLLQVLVIAFLQLTAIPFVTILGAQTLNPREVPHVEQNVTVIAKSEAGAIPGPSMYE